MKSIKSVLMLLLLLGPLSATVAQAEHGHAGGGFHGGHVGVFIDPWPWFYPYSYYPYGYYPYAGYPAAVVTQEAPTVYMEQGAPAQQSATPAASGDWYYCRNPEGYYPYVRSCTGGWQRVPAQPPTQH